MATRPTVLVVEDDPDVRELIRDYLTENGYDVLEAAGGEAARGLLEERVPDVVLLDVGLPGEDGLSLARFIRERFDIAIVIVSGAGETVDRIVGLEVGADDYIAKPFDPRELRARLKSVLHRYQRNATPAEVPPASALPATRKVPVGRAILDLDTRQLFERDGAEVALTGMEYDLLRVFVERPNRPLSRDQILMLTRNREWDPYDRSVDIRIARLRRKVEPDPNRPQVLRTVRGVGYMFVPGT
jgi:two-component system phosphate regulon response regulator OmpR